METSAGRVLAGKLRLESPLASGGMGHVWLGRHLLLDLPVALKFMDASLSDSPEALARFEREAKAAAQLRSQHIVQILDYGIDEGAPFIVMEHLTGEDLRARLERRKKLSIGETAELVTQIAKGLKLAHDAGIVHRDLKPGNIFLAKVGDEEIAKILDFGVAKATGARSGETTTTGRLLGSPEYMSPEQARGGDLDARSDLWSLGVIAFRALTGRRPFNGSHVGDLLVKICSDPLPRATAIAPELPPSLDDFFDRALCKSPDGRFATARALADALAEIAAQNTPERLSSSAPEARTERTSGTLGTSAPALTAASSATSNDAQVSSLPEVAERTQATVSIGVVASSKADEPPPRPRRWLWAAGAALLVGIGVAATQSSRFQGAAPSATASALPAPPTTTSGAPTVTLAAEATSAALATPPPSASASASVRAAPSAGLRRPPRGAPTQAPPSVDPKFGLPVPK